MLVASVCIIAVTLTTIVSMGCLLGETFHDDSLTYFKPIIKMFRRLKNHNAIKRILRGV